MIIEKNHFFIYVYSGWICSSILSPNEVYIYPHIILAFSNTMFQDLIKYFHSLSNLRFLKKIILFQLHKLSLNCAPAVESRFRISDLWLWDTYRPYRFKVFLYQIFYQQLLLLHSLNSRKHKFTFEVTFAHVHLLLCIIL